MQLLTQQLVHFDDLPPLDPNSIEAQIGNTPLLDLSAFAHAHGVSPAVEVRAKAEWFNPSGSVKARPALNIIRNAEYDGRLQTGMTLIDSTSGNTGIAYAMLGAARGFNVKLVIPASVSPERIKILRAYGAQLILTDPEDGADGAMLEVRALAAADDSLFYANQYDNPANWQAHYWTTAPEIWRQTEGRITHFVTGLGTSGTFTGTTRRLREFDREIVTIAALPDSPVNKVEGWKHMPTAINPRIYDPYLADETIQVTANNSRQMAKALAREIGLFVSPSAGGAITSAIQVARELDEGVVVTVMADNAYKYLSEGFWGGVAELRGCGVG